jgi:hypothetical protein
VRATLPFERIEGAIAQIMKGGQQVAVPSHKDLLEEPASSGLACCAEAEGEAEKLKKRKYGKVGTNFLAASRQENEHEGFEAVSSQEVLLTVSLYHSEKVTHCATLETR